MSSQDVVDLLNTVSPLKVGIYSLVPFFVCIPPSSKWRVHIFWVVKRSFGAKCEHDDMVSNCPIQTFKARDVDVRIKQDLRGELSDSAIGQHLESGAPRHSRKNKSRHPSSSACTISVASYQKRG